MATQSVETIPISENIGLIARFFRGAKWYGAEWYITVSGGIILILIFLMTILAPHLAPYDPVKPVGSPFTAPGGGRQVLIVRSEEEATQKPADLAGILVGVRANSTGQFRALELGAEVKKFYEIEECFPALTEGQVDALVVEEYVAPEFIPAYANRLKQVGEPFGQTFALGTDNLGRDILSRVIFGARAVLLVAVLSASFSALVGIPVGLLSGFIGGALDRVLSLIMDSVYSFPGLILAIAMAAVLQLQMQRVLENVMATIGARLSGDQIAVITGTMTTTVAIAVVYVPTFFRMVRGQVLAIKQQLYVEAARSLESSPYLPARISRSSNTGVSRAVPPWRLKISAMVLKMRSRSRASDPDQSLVPLGVFRLKLVLLSPHKHSQNFCYSPWWRWSWSGSCWSF